MLEQFDIVPNPNKATVRYFPYLCVLQHDLLFQLDTVLVAPLRLLRNTSPVKLHLNVRIDIFDKPHVLLVEYISPELRKSIKSVAMSAAAQRAEIKRAIDTIFDGV